MPALPTLRRAMAALALVAVSATASATPDFVGKPSDVYEGYVAINGPRADVPVGALWIDDFGPHGAGAGSDNLETVRGLSGITISKDFELKLTAGLLEFLGIAPGLRKNFVARFGDLSIVRVKDLTRLQGPASEPRIIEAIKAGTVSITSGSDLSLDLDKRNLNSPFATRLDSGKRGSFGIEGRDMFIAFKVASLEEIRSRPVLLDLEKTRGEVAVDGALIAVGGASCSAPDSCKVSWSAVQEDSKPSSVEHKTDRRQPLLVPVADGLGGLFTAAEVEVVLSCEVAKSEGCGRNPKLRATLIGTRSIELKQPSAKGW